MATSQQILPSFEAIPLSLQLVGGALILSVIYMILTGDRPLAGFPVVKVDRKGWQRFLPDRSAFLTHGKEMLLKGLRENSGPFQLNTGTGYKIYMPSRFADEIKSSPNVSLIEAVKHEIFHDYPGMDGQREGVRDETFIQEVVRVKLTQSLGLVTEDLVDETADALHRNFGEDPEWTTTAMRTGVLDIVARLSARVFLGLELCRNERWLQISKDYAVDTFVAQRLLRVSPGLLRPLVYWFIPVCTRLRKGVRDARRLITPEVEKRITQAREATASGGKPAKASDAIAWMVECSKDRDTDYVAAQLLLSTVAIHTTSETITKCLIQLCETPEIIEPLRREILQVLTTEGWSRVSLYKLRLLDSFLKEVQRTNIMDLATMNRLVMKPITLSNGTTLPAGARIMVSNDKFFDPNVFAEPEKFDVARFMQLRAQPGEENRHQFVSLHSSHMAFGHGQHACPGRFFASNEIKIALCFLLLKYDIRRVPGDDTPMEMSFETSRMTHPKMRMQVRRRKEEINLLDPLKTI